jgi:hypothetical protein
MLISNQVTFKKSISFLTQLYIARSITIYATYALKWGNIVKIFNVQLYCFHFILQADLKMSFKFTMTKK